MPEAVFPPGPSYYRTSAPPSTSFHSPHFSWHPCQNSSQHPDNPGRQGSCHYIRQLSILMSRHQEYGHKAYQYEWIENTRFFSWTPVHPDNSNHEQHMSIPDTNPTCEEYIPSSIPYLHRNGATNPLLQVQAYG